jgi:sulfite exporter TauE/SafE
MELEARLAGAFVTGLLGSGHCFGMCGGIAGALALSGGTPAARRPPLARVAAQNFGRIVTYAALGAAVGFLASELGGRVPVEVARRGGRWLGAVCFAGLALYLLGRPGLLAPLERAGSRLFGVLRPLRGRLAGRRSLAAAALAGAAWGFLPCGLLYSALLLAATGGDPLTGASTMLAFGAGTLPALFAAGAASRYFARLARGATLRRLAAVAYLAAAALLVRGALAAPSPTAPCHDAAGPPAAAVPAPPADR